MDSQEIDALRAENAALQSVPGIRIEKNDHLYFGIGLLCMFSDFHDFEFLACFSLDCFAYFFTFMNLNSWHVF